LFHAGKFAESFEQFRESRDIDPNMNHPNVSLGRLFTQKDDIERARKAFERAYKEDGDTEATAHAYAEWLIQQDKLEQAGDVAATLRDAYPDSVRALLLEGIIARLQGDASGVQQAMSAILDLDVSNSSAIDLLALTLIESENDKDREKALGYAQMNAERYQNQTKPNVTLAWVLHRLGRKREADVALQKAVKAGNVNADSAYLIANILAERDQKERAAEMLQQLMDQAGSGVFLFRKDAEQLLQELQASRPTN
ncbi:MAG: hypothetical protein AAF961_18545, partial [Planctomycetota bacterium]